MVEIQELDYGYLVKHLPVRNPNRQVNSVFNCLYPDIHKHNPEYVEKEHKQKKVWSLMHADNDLYVHPGLLKDLEGFLGVIFTNKPYKNQHIIIKL